MANLKAIRRRIKSVQATKKITTAMKMVAAAKVRRAQQRTLAARPFTTRVVRMLREMVREVQPIDLQDIPLLQPHARVQKVALLVITSDRGLCGAYNSTIVRATLERVKQLQAEGKEASLILVGMKGVAFFRSFKSIPKHKTYTLLPAVPTVEEAKLIAKNAEELFLKGDVDTVEIISTRFISMLRSEIAHFQFLPVELPPPAPEEQGANPLMLFDPGITEVLQTELVPKYVENVVFQALLEASASELAARMNAMSNASTNAQELINTLTLVYNKARQSNITQELLEVVAGAEALRA